LECIVLITSTSGKTIKRLKDEKGIGKIEVDYMSDSVVVEFDPLLINKEEIKHNLEKSGYKFVRMPR
jgi:Cu+-exporting ATPase